jgi:hypothetical protein
VVSHLFHSLAFLENVGYDMRPEHPQPERNERRVAVFAFLPAIRAWLGRRKDARTERA